MRTIRLLLASVAVLLLAAAPLGGCSRQSSPRGELSERQRDSILGTEPLPGASTVTRALDASDKAAAAAKQTDAQVDSMPH